MAKLDTDPKAGGLAADPGFFPNGEAFRGLRVHQTRLQGGEGLQRLLLPHPLTMRPIAHHAAEDSLLNLLVLGGSGLSVAAAIARAWLATTRARLTRFRDRGT